MVDGLTRRFEVGPTDLRATLVTQGMYPGDPTHRWYPNGFAKAVLTPEGPGTMHLSWTSGGDVEATAWGAGAAWLLEQAPAWLGRLDDVTGFDPSRNRRVAELWRRHGDFRLSRGGVIWQELVLVLLGQRVATAQAVATFAQLCTTRGAPAPGPGGLRMPPTPAAVAAMSIGDLHLLDVERRRADALLLAARRASRLEEAATMDADAALRRLTALPGLGVWTATSVVTVSHGDPDVIVLGDYGLPTLVNYAFTGESRRLPPDRGGDEIMCAHLEPWRGHRQRIVRLLFAAGISAPRRAARRANPDIRRL